MSATATPTKTTTALEASGIVLDGFSTVKTRSLSAMDRCDRGKSEAAKVRAVKNGSELVFCVHHANKHVPTLVSQGWLIDDQS